MLIYGKTYQVVQLEHPLDYAALPGERILFEPGENAAPTTLVITNVGASKLQGLMNTVIENAKDREGAINNMVRSMIKQNFVCGLFQHGSKVPMWIINRSHHTERKYIAALSYFTNEYLPKYGPADCWNDVGQSAFTDSDKETFQDLIRTYVNRSRRGYDVNPMPLKEVTYPISSLKFHTVRGNPVFDFTFHAGRIHYGTIRPQMQTGIVISGKDPIVFEPAGTDRPSRPIILMTEAWYERHLASYYCGNSEISQDRWDRIIDLAIEDKAIAAIYHPNFKARTKLWYDRDASDNVMECIAKLITSGLWLEKLYDVQDALLESLHLDEDMLGRVTALLNDQRRDVDLRLPRPRHEYIYIKEMEEMGHLAYEQSKEKGLAKFIPEWRNW